MLVLQESERNLRANDHLSQVFDLLCIVDGSISDVLHIFVDRLVLPPLVDHECLVGILIDPSETHVDVGAQVIDSRGVSVDFKSHFVNLLLDLTDLFLGFSRVTLRVPNVGSYLRVAVTLGIHLVLGVVSSQGNKVINFLSDHGNKVINFLSELIDILDLLCESLEVCLIFVLERPNSLRKILEGQAGTMSGRTASGGTGTGNTLHRTEARTAHAILSEDGSTRTGCVRVVSVGWRHGEWLVVALRNIGAVSHLGWRWQSRRGARFDLRDSEVTRSIFQDRGRDRTVSYTHLTLPTTPYV